MARLSLIFLDLVTFNYIIGPICTLVRLGLFVAVIANYVAVISYITGSKECLPETFLGFFPDVQSFRALGSKKLWESGIRPLAPFLEA